jgi:hypothetical protein
MITEQELQKYTQWLMAVWNPNHYLRHEHEVKNLDIPRVINWVAITDRMPPRPDEDYLVVMRNKNKEGGIALQDIKNYTSDGTWVGGNNWEDVVTT